jgi:uncharacterized membrane protein YccC
MGSAELVHRPKRVGDAMAEAAAAIQAWRAATTDAAGLSRGLVRVRAQLPLVRQLCRDRSAPDEEVIRCAAVIARLRQFFAAVTAYAESYEAAISGEKPEPHRIGFAHSNDPVVALWTRLRAALAGLAVSSFWILTNWAHGSTARSWAPWQRRGWRRWRPPCPLHSAPP